MKGAYLAYQIFSTALFRIPLWIILSLAPSWRPRKSWSFKQALLIRAIRHLMKTSAKTGPLMSSPDYLALAPGNNGVWVEPDASIICGNVATWAEKAQVVPVRLPGYWIHKKNSTIPVSAPPMPGEKVIYALHGGAYVRMSAHPSDPTAAIARKILKHCDVVQRVFQVEYRLSSTRPFAVKGPFPTALIDALMGYNYLVNVVGFSPSDIIIEGDSAGGNLCQALTRYLVEMQGSSAKIPSPPTGIIMLSPWVDLGISHEVDGSSVFTCINSDYLVVPHLESDSSRLRRNPWANAAFLGPHGSEMAETNPYISPASRNVSASFIGFPRIFLAGGGAEILIDQIRTLKNKMIADIGEEHASDHDGEAQPGKVTYYEEVDAPHDYVVLSFNDLPTLHAISAWIRAG